MAFQWNSKEDGEDVDVDTIDVVVVDDDGDDVDDDDDNDDDDDDDGDLIATPAWWWLNMWHLTSLHPAPAVMQH